MKNILLFIGLIFNNFIYAQFTEHSVTLRSSFVEDIDVVDLDGDGDLDILSASRRDNKVAWYVNEGDETIECQMIISTEQESVRALHPVDIDQDGDIDIISGGSSSNQLIWHVNAGNTEFNESIVVGSDFPNTSKILSGDLNKDGYTDIIVSDEYEEGIYWYEYEGGTGFKEKKMISIFGINTSVLDMHLVDVDKDDDLDIIASINNTVVEYRNKGNGVFQRVVLHNNFNELNEIGIGDLDNDGWVDIVCTDSKENEISWLKNNGNGEFGEPQLISDRAYRAHWITIGDMNGDGFVDILVLADIQSAIYCFLNNRDGSFDKHNTTSVIGDTIEILLGDFNQDNTLDMVWASTFESMIIWRENDGEAYWKQEHTVTTKTEDDSIVKSMDVDRDGDLDIVTLSKYPAYMAWYENKGNSKFGSRKMINIFLSSPVDMVITDLDKDGFEDIIIADTGKSIVWHPGRVEGGFETRRTITTEASSVTSLVCADLDQDGYQDIVFNHTANSEIVWYKNKGDRTFAEKQFVTKTYPSLDRLAVEDFNNDGHKDVVGTSSSYRNLRWFANNGTGIFTEQAELADNFYDGYGTHFVDIDLDNDIDIVYPERDDYSNVFLENDGTGHFSSQPFNLPYVDVVEIADLNKDGLLDILYNHGIYLKAAYQTTNGNFENSIIITPLCAGQAHVVDLDGDNDMDFVTVSEDPSRAAIMWYENHPFAVGIEHFNRNYSVKASPNPFSDYTTIEVDGLPQGNHQLQVMDIFGRKIRELKLDNGKIELNRGNLESGLYLIQVLEEGNENKILGSEKILIE